MIGSNDCGRNCRVCDGSCQTEFNFTPPEGSDEKMKKSIRRVKEKMDSDRIEKIEHLDIESNKQETDIGLENLDDNIQI